MHSQVIAESLGVDVSFCLCVWVSHPLRFNLNQTHYLETNPKDSGKGQYEQVVIIKLLHNMTV